MNNLTSIPESIGKLENLEHLDFESNQINFLPEFIGNLKLLIKLGLEDNNLTTLPISIENLKDLTYLDLRSNPINNLSNFPLRILEIMQITSKFLTNKAQRLYKEARSAYGSASYSKVIDLTSKAIVEYEKFAIAFALRGKAQKDMGDIEKAFKDLNKAIKLDPKLGEAYYVRAQANEIMGEMDKAKADYKKGCSAGYRSACQ